MLYPHPQRQMPSPPECAYAAHQPLYYDVDFGDEATRQDPPRIIDRPILAAPNTAILIRGDHPARPETDVVRVEVLCEVLRP
jgi:hypothetical protein